TDVAYTVHNTGNTRLNLRQGISVTGLFGITLGSSTPKGVTDLIPGGSYRVNQHVSGVFPTGPMSVHLTVNPTEMDGFPPAGSAPVAVSHDVGFWATPWPQLLLLIVLIGLFFGVRWWLLRNRQVTESKVAAAVARTRRELTDDTAVVPVAATSQKAER